MQTNSGSLKLATPDDREVVMTRVFDAPREFVFEALSDPELIAKWLSGPDGWEMTDCDIDLRTGGTYRYTWRDESGAVTGLRGVYREVKSPERIASTERFDDGRYPGRAFGTLVLREAGDRTILVNTIVYESQAARDAVLRSGIVDGIALAYDRLAEMLAMTAAA